MRPTDYHRDSSRVPTRNCPSCGDPIQHIDTCGPTDIRAQPCNCPISQFDAREVLGEPIPSDRRRLEVTTGVPNARGATNTTAVYVHRATSRDPAASDYIYVSFAQDGIYHLDVPAIYGSVEEWVETKVQNEFDGDHGEERLDELVPSERERTGDPIRVGRLYFNHVEETAIALELDADAFQHAHPDATDDGLRADGGRTLLQEWHALNGFQRDILRSILAVAATDQDTYGLAIKRELESRYGEEINHGRLYPNLNTLVQDGLLAKTRLDNRTNEYALTASATDLLDDALTEDAHLVDSTYYAEPVTEHTPAQGDD